MIETQDIQKIIDKYDYTKLSVGTLGSHSSLNIFKGAKEEGLRTVCICREKDAIMYQKYPVVDELIIVKDFTELLSEPLQERLRKLNVILIPHGSFTAYLSTEQLIESLKVPMMGNRKLLQWEANRKSQEEWLRQAGLRLPATFKSPENIDRLVIAKMQGAKGGRGYFLANSSKGFYKRADEMLKRGLITKQDIETVHLQEYVLGVNVYPSYFSSLLNNDVELLAMDRRYETAVDSIGKIPASEQLEIDITPTYSVVGNFPIVLRESLLPDIMRMGEAVHKKAAELAYPGIIGPFCLETVITDDLKIYTFEISARIVAGTNVGIGTSPYAYLRYGENMYMGRRIALELKNAVKQKQLQDIIA
ncbi:MAG: formate--phosphoribosylaminoimidazolecarboxamide ligase [Candidatus Bathyarchaeota archaeon]|uniref:formate--phosphoribosylaminoimidazolecarboxamide ligase n=1 Tax=Candidatus Bathycorpusculum sp. TaxID=2994959 RepID=UPI00282DE453|nr:formate--phosphoribosylaminoimidazolecarboxamide ligase [Candidatus Termiticorpusculum sp.]MCL2258158.1 formate--phosphoribosylaminoimidazolecarboxamide ligase [Candidatus Termiticorpusculum sp.]MCL2291536.1 formate--phosphoribosylaminoimidazolecarboxamide ligase [Candidatus Termiticorpusculum sp.]